MRTYYLLLVGLLRSFIVLAITMLLYIHWSWWMNGVSFPQFWWLYDFAFLALLALFWMASVLVLKLTKER